MKKSKSTKKQATIKPCDVVSAPKLPAIHPVIPFVL